MVEGQNGVTWEQWLALAEAAERSGLEGLFRSDHYTLMGDEPGALDAWATLAALAARTSRIRLGSMVSPVTFRHPTVVAKCATTVDHVSGGRVELGLGAGWMEDEHRAYGFDFPPIAERVEMLAEQVEIVHRLWEDDRLTFEGRHYRYDGARGIPKPVQRPHPPLIVGGAARRGTVEPAVRWADEYDTTFVSPEECERRRRRLDEACERAGRDPATLRFSLMTNVIVGADRDELRARARPVMAMTGADGDPDEWLADRRDRTIVGTTEEVVERIREYEAAGVERLFAQHLDHADVGMVELLGREVAPAVT
jgi:F420-dependent oxidoreductase-like protein